MKADNVLTQVNNCKFSNKELMRLRQVGPSFAGREAVARVFNYNSDIDWDTTTFPASSLLCFLTAISHTSFI
jgi:hypothetical protein